MLIAEIGNNHLGSLERLGTLTDAALLSDVDGLTIQIREDSYYLSPEKQTRLTNLQYAAWCERVAETGKKVGIAVCEVSHLDIFECDFYKILSKDYFNQELVSAALRTGKPVYISCGDINIDDLDLWSGYANAHFIHTEFSPHTEDVNLKAILSMQMRVGNRVAFGRHCNDIHVLPAAVAFEPDSIWFYIKDDMQNQPDFNHAVHIAQLKDVSFVLKELKKAIGDGRKIRKERKM